MGFLQKDVDSMTDEQAELYLKNQLKNKINNIERKNRELNEKLDKPPERSSQLICTVLGARNLDNRDFGGKSDPFVRVTILPPNRNRNKYQTQVEWDTMNPEWNETVTFEFKPFEDKYMLLEVYHHDNMAPVPLGHLEFDLRTLQLDTPVTLWKKLDGSSKKGEIGFKLEHKLEPEATSTSSELVLATPASPSGRDTNYAAPTRARSLAYQAMEIPPEDIPPDPWAVLESNEGVLSADEVTRRHDKISAVFGDWDMDGSGRIEFDEIQQIVVSFRGCDMAKQERVLKKWGTLVACKQIPRAGYERETLLPFIIRLTNAYSAYEFDTFVEHILDTIQVMLDITESGRRTKATWRLFKAWDTNCNLTLDTNQLEHIIKATDFGKAHMDLLEEGLEKPRKLYPERLGVDDVGIAEFHEFMDGLLGHLSEIEMNFVIGQIRTAMREEKLEDDHVVSKYLSANKKLYGGDVPADGQVTEDERLTDKLMWQLQSDARHAFDALAIEDIEECVNNRNPPPFYVIIATPICLLFGLKPAQNVKTGKLDYWEGLKEFIVDDPARFLHFLQNFECNKVQYDLVQKMMYFHFKEESDPHFLLFHSRFMSCLCVWCEASVRLSCLINGWEYPPPPIEDEELINPTFNGSGRIDRYAEDTIPGFMREYPANVQLGIDPPKKQMHYRLPRWGVVKDWGGAKEEEKKKYDPVTGKLVTVDTPSAYKGPPPVQSATANRPTTTVPESGALNRLVLLLEGRKARHNEARTINAQRRSIGFQEHVSDDREMDAWVSLRDERRRVQFRKDWTSDKIEKKIRLVFTDKLEPDARFRLINEEDMEPIAIENIQEFGKYAIELTRK